MTPEERARGLCDRCRDTETCCDACDPIASAIREAVSEALDTGRAAGWKEGHEQGVEDEREACARLVESTPYTWSVLEPGKVLAFEVSWNKLEEVFAAAIRARGKA